MKKYILGFAVFATWAMPLFSQVSNDNEDEVNKIDTRWAQDDYVPGQVLMKFKDTNRVGVKRVRGRFASTSVDKVTQVLQKYGTEDMEQLLPNENPNRQLRRARSFNGDMIQERDLSQLYCLKLTTEHQHETMQLIEELNALDEVEYAEPNYYCYIMGTNYIGGNGVEGNPLLGRQWYLSAYGVRELWDQPIVNSDRPVIAIIDTGVDTTHPDLKDNCVEGYDFINYSTHVIDDNMHGTHVAGIAAACNNGIGIVGANPLALIMPIKVMDKNGHGNTATILQGVNYAVEHGAKILNMSLGGYGYSKAAADVYRNASLSAIIVAAAGNDGKCIYGSHTGLLKHGVQPEPAFPAAYSFVLGVQATDRNGNIASFSNYDDDGPLYSCEASLDEPDGFNYELKAPGTEILSTVPGGRYETLQGTSMASPLVAGAISALMMVKQYDSQEQLWAELLHTDNIAQAFYLKELPIELDIVRVLLGERTDFTEETDADYFNIKEVKAGETVKIYPVVRCTSGEASNISLKLEIGDYEDPDVVQIETGEADFGWHLDTYGKGVSKNPLVVTFPEDIPDERHVRLKLLASCDEQEGYKSQILTFLARNKVDGLHGTITSDMTLTPDRVYYVDDNLFVDKGVKLTIEPGTRIEFEERKGLSVSGILEANGTPENPIVFTSHNVERKWNGIDSGENFSYQSYLYMNSDTTLFSIIPTEETPIKVLEYELKKSLYYDSNIEDRPLDNFFMEIYAEDLDEDDILSKKLQADPFYLTPTILKGLEEWKEYCSHYSSSYSRPKMEVTNRFRFLSRNFQIKLYDRYIDTISYCRFEDVALGNYLPYMKDCIIKKGSFQVPNLPGNRNVLMDCPNLSYSCTQGKSYTGKKQKYWNYVNNKVPYVKFSDLMVSNYLYNEKTSGEDEKKYYLGISVNEPEVDHSDYPSYLGTGREDFIRPYVYETGNSTDITWGTIDLNNMRTTPVPEAHGIVWKVCVNGKDAQDEYEDMAPLGVGKHKFEVYFNRPMNKEVAPQVSFGIRDPWTQNPVDEDGGWNEEGTIYTVYKTITGKTNSDGVNRIYVHGAEDNEFFPCPYEKSRFNINVQAAGSMATGFAAEASLGRVILTWDNSQNDMEDAMGYNVYRYCNEMMKTIPGHYDDNWHWIDEIQVPDTIRINHDILGVETSEFIDYDVEPGHTYYYLYKVLSTDLKEYDISNIVAATPLTAMLGDANGNGEVDVADVVTTVNYAVGMKPDPFIFDAADMNEDKNIDVLDVIGIVQKVLHPNAASIASIEDYQAKYTIENGILYVESPTDLAGIQVQLTLDRRSKKEDVRTSDELKGFEQSSAWLTDDDYLLIAYSLNGKTLAPGKHAILFIGDSELTSLRIADAYGHNVSAVVGEGTTNIEAMGSRVQRQEGIYDLQGRKLSPLTTHLSPLKKGVYIINGQKVVK